MTSSISLEQYSSDMNWITAHYEELKTRFSDQYVAVLDAEVIDSDKAIDPLIDRLSERFGDSVSEIAVKRIFNEDPKFVLSPM